MWVCWRTSLEVLILSFYQQQLRDLKSQYETKLQQTEEKLRDSQSQLATFETTYRECVYTVIINHAFFFVLKKNGQFWVNFNDIWLKYMCSCCEWSCVYRYYHIHCIYRLFEICHYYYCVYKWETNVDMYYLISDN